MAARVVCDASEEAVSHPTRLTPKECLGVWPNQPWSFRLGGRRGAAARNTKNRLEQVWREKDAEASVEHDQDTPIVAKDMKGSI